MFVPHLYGRPRLRLRVSAYLSVCPSVLTCRRPRQMPVPLADLVSAVLYGLQRELLRLPLEDAPERHAALIAWLQTLASLFPGARNREALGRLTRQVASTPRLDARTWRSLLLDYDGPLLPQGAAAGGIAWSACRGWSEEARGCAPPHLERVRSLAHGLTPPPPPPLPCLAHD